MAINRLFSRRFQHKYSRLPKFKIPQWMMYVHQFSRKRCRSVACANAMAKVVKRRLEILGK